MLKFLMLALIYLPTTYARVHPELPPELINAPYPISRYFRSIPIEEAHSYRGMARFQILDSEKVNILVWNVQKLKQKGWPEEFQVFSENKDLILLQEAYENELFLNETASLNDLRWDFGKSFEYLLYGITTGNMIGANTQPKNVTVLHSPDNEPILDTPKATLATYYQLTNQENPLLVISIHGINFTTNKAFYRQLNQVFSLIDEHQGPVIFAGDFNTHNKKRLSFLEKESRKRKLKNLDFKNSHLRKKFSGNILDYTFARNVEIIESYVPENSKGSDHPPMILSLKIKSQP
ncbi:MAG TPA: endonuclease/exonuclease/phosphatase family protein [Bacteriovoracaceae bacterium]|nr:endonuclease/exonuclease/phosphatase family protein [Bacteriovoracaceae bacterium]